jgi:hypothetical protein
MKGERGGRARMPAPVKDAIGGRLAMLAILKVDGGFMPLIILATLPRLPNLSAGDLEFGLAIFATAFPLRFI